jgi:hypothetical protein
MTALYELTADFKTVAARLEELELDADTIRDTLDGYGAEFDNKVIAIASLIRNHEVTIAAIKEAEAQMIARRKGLERKVDWLRDYVINNMKAIGKTRVECPMFAVNVRVNPVSVAIQDGQLLPAEYVVRKTTELPDKKALKAALESGVVIEGVSLVSSNTLLIK